jgi:hypothetical protein
MKKMMIHRCHENCRFSIRSSQDFFLSKTLKKKKEERDFNINLLFFLEEFKEIYILHSFKVHYDYVIINNII